MRNPLPAGNLPSRFLYPAIFFLILFMALAGTAAAGAKKNKLTIENQSGEEITIKISGLWEWTLDIPANEERTILLPAGPYRYLVRYGPESNYRFSRGKPFEIEQNRGGFTEATLTLISAPTHQHQDPDIVEEFKKPASPYPVPTKPLKTGDSEDFLLHRVKAGETLPSIIQWYSGLEEAWPEAAKHNPGVDPLHLKPGTLLKIPSYLAVIHNEPPAVKRALPPFRHGQKKAPPPLILPPPLPAAPADDGFGPK